ncbi:SDR family oxidoreductase [Hyphomicrobium sp. CS1BSMeth3]|uniref:SDR family oxidoreductase n=1 Tax=Hyphomicrobium sp. CS1BSMeth3 TaxID=1892844 RepID=UPI000930380B|nr:SDR family oxidoreductase [Hyphomicrobium sp. CS1BSMeth3]
MDRLRELRIGQTEMLSRRIDADDVATFARLSGDYNELHIDEEFAARTEFSERVVHGFLHASLLSALIGTRLPGRGALYVSQALEFTRPVFIGDIVEARATIEKIDEETRLVTLGTQIHKADGTCVLRGTALVKVLRLTEPAPVPKDAPAMPRIRLLEDRTALVTGSSRGIGRAIARLLAAQGASVWINYRRSRTAAESLEREIIDRGGRCHLIGADVTDETDVRRLAEEIGGQGGLDILVHNAGPRIRSAPFSDLSWSDLSTAHEEIVGSAFRVTKALLPALKQSKGKIITILTSASLGRTAHNWLPYVAAKAALLAMGKNLAQELGPQGVTVNMISPSMIDTDLTANIPDRVRQAMVSRTPLRRLATAEDVAGAVLLLASPYASFISGENLLVTGGETMI